MIEKALKYLVGLGEAHVHDVTFPDGTVQTYSDKPLNNLTKRRYYAHSIRMSTLTSLVDYIKSHVDEMADKMVVHVVSPTEVCLFSQLDDVRERERMVEVLAQIPEFEYGRFIDHETFCINVQAKFLGVPDTDKELLLKFAGTVESGSVSEYGDDGITQKATVKNGIASKMDAIVPNPVRMCPFRTFIEVPQPVSDFVFRMRDRDGIQCALFEADGGAWKNEAMKNVKEYLESELEDYEEQFIVIS